MHTLRALLGGHGKWKPVPPDQRPVVQCTPMPDHGRIQYLYQQQSYRLISSKCIYWFQYLTWRNVLLQLRHVHYWMNLSSSRQVELISHFANPCQNLKWPKEPE
jgi:hypothetical protein